MTTSRRRLLIGLAGLATIAWSWQRFGVKSVNLTFAPIPGLDGWQQARTGALSVGGSATDAVFLGIGEDRSDPLPPDQLCATLYPTGPNRRPVAVFTDINCPNCRSLEAKLDARRDTLRVTYLQLPLLGPGSELAARVAVASEVLSGMPAEPPKALRGSGLAALIRYHANRTGLDPAKLEESLDHPDVTVRLARHRAAADTLGVFGTPALTIGKTLVMGDIPADTLDDILALDQRGCG